MTTTSELFATAEAAIEFEVARRVAKALKAQRDPIDCERENREGFSDARNTAQTAPCWKLWKEDRTGEGFDRDAIPTWCASCQRRQVLTDALRKANRTRGARQRTLQRCALKSIDPRTIERQVRAMAEGHEGATEKDTTEEQPAGASAQGDGDQGDPVDETPIAPTEGN